MTIGMKLNELQKILANFGSERESFTGLYKVANDGILIGHYMFSHGTGASRSNIVNVKKGDEVYIRDEHSRGEHWLTFIKGN